MNVGRFCLGFIGVTIRQVTRSESLKLVNELVGIADEVNVVGICCILQHFNVFTRALGQVSFKSRVAASKNITQCTGDLLAVYQWWM